MTGAERVRDAFRARFGRAPSLVVRSPGRVALLGAHIDTSDGFVMPAAIERAVWLAASPRADRRLRLHALDLEEDAERDLDHPPPPVPDRPDGAAHWSDLPVGLALALEAEGGFRATGLDAVYGGDLPSSAGVSSSAAVEMAFGLAWRAAGSNEDGRGLSERSELRRPPTVGQEGSPAAGSNEDGRGLSERSELRRPPAVGPAAWKELAIAGRRCENEYLGVRSGIMDQLGCLFGQADHALLVDCRTLEIEALPLPDDLVVLVFDSGVRRRLSDAGGFNDRRAECEKAVEILRGLLPADRSIANLRDVTLEDLERHASALPSALERRARHAVVEMARVRRAAENLRRGDVEALGRAMRASHESSRDLYEVSIPELDRLASAAWDAEGCLGARLMGGGFGGTVAALVRADAADRVEAEVAGRFTDAFGRRPDAFRTRLADGAQIVDPGIIGSD